MERATVRDLRYRFPEIEKRLRLGREIVITKRGKAIGRLLPMAPAQPVWPDFAARRRAIFGNKRMKITAAALVSEGRGDR